MATDGCTLKAVKPAIGVFAGVPTGRDDQHQPSLWWLNGCTACTAHRGLCLSPAIRPTSRSTPSKESTSAQEGGSSFSPLLISHKVLRDPTLRTIGSRSTTTGPLLLPRIVAIQGRRSPRRDVPRLGFHEPLDCPFNTGAGPSHRRPRCSCPATQNRVGPYSQAVNPQPTYTARWSGRTTRQRQDHAGGPRPPELSRHSASTQPPVNHRPPMRRPRDRPVSTDHSPRSPACAPYRAPGATRAVAPGAA